MTNKQLIVRILNKTRATAVQRIPEEHKAKYLLVDEFITGQIEESLPDELATLVIDDIGSIIRKTVSSQLAKSLLED